MLSPAPTELPAAAAVRAETSLRTSALVRGMLVVLGVYAVSRVAFVVCAAVLASRHHTSVASILGPWDGPYYESVAASGYPSHIVIGPNINSTPSALIAFFPLFPLLGHAVSWVTGLSLAWAMPAVTWTAGALAAVAAVPLVAPRYGVPRAVQAGVMLAVFPGSVVAGLVYADALAVAFAVLALLAADRRRFVVAGVLGAGATASLSLMLVPVVGALAACALVARRWRGLVAPMLAACGAGAYFLYLWIHTGSAFNWSRVEHAGWLVHLSLPWRGVTAFSAYPFSTLGSTVLTTGSIALALAGLVLLAVLRAPLSWVVMSVVVLAAVTFDGGAWIAPRFLFDAFPLVLAMGIALPKRAVVPVAVLSVVVLALLLAAYSPFNRVFFNP